MKKVKLNKILKNGKAIFLAYDQGLEHGPTDFNDKNVDPKYIIEIAKKSKINALIFQKGIVEKYQKEIKKSKIPLILKLNGKTKIRKDDPFSPLICTVNEAIDLGADAVGYTIYIGSKYESKMFEEFEKVEQKAHAKSLPVIAWIYPRGKNVNNDTSKEMIAYSARVGLELGADIVKIKYGNNSNDLEWAVKSAGKTKVMISGGTKRSEIDFLRQIKDIMKAGAIGMAIGRNIWQHPKPLEIIKKIQKIVFGK